jgi:hypothetical protein
MAKYHAVTPEFTTEEAQALLACVRKYESIRLKTGGPSDQFLVGAASRLHSAMRYERVPTGDEEWMREQAEDVRRHPMTHKELD